MSANHKPYTPVHASNAGQRAASAPPAPIPVAPNEIEGLDAVRAILFGQQQKAITQQLDDSSSALKQQITELTQHLAQASASQTEARAALAVQLNAKIDALIAEHSSKTASLQQQFNHSFTFCERQQVNDCAALSHT